MVHMLSWMPRKRSNPTNGSAENPGGHTNGSDAQLHAQKTLRSHAVSVGLRSAKVGDPACTGSGRTLFVKCVILLTRCQQGSVTANREVTASMPLSMSQ